MVYSPRSVVLAIFLAVTLSLAQISPAYAASLPAEINKQFTPLQIDTGGVSILKITIFNPNVYPLTNVAFTDNLVGVQPGLFIADAGLVSNSCGGSITATPGTNSIALSNGGVSAQTTVPGQCSIEVAVSSVTEGNLINTIPAHNPPTAVGLTATGTEGPITNTSPASATISVIAVDPPSMSKVFNPNTIYVGGTSQLTIRINNNDPDTNLTNVSFTDNLPTVSIPTPGNMELANPVSASMTGCGAGAALVANPGGTSFSFSGGTITPAVDCIIRVNVTGDSGAYTNTIPAGPGGPGSLRTQQGVTNRGPISADLNIQPVNISKAFAPTTVDAGDTAILTITLQNPTNAPYTGASLSDVMPAGLTVLASPIPTTTCGAGIVTIPSADTLSMTGGTVPARPSPSALGTCTVTATVQAALSATGTLTNNIPPGAFSANGGAVQNIDTTEADLVITPALTAAKSYAAPYVIGLGGTNLVTITLFDNSSTPFTDVDFSDDLPVGLTVATTPTAPANPTTSCGTGTVTYDTDTVTLANGTIDANSSCTVTFYVTSNTPGSGNTYENTLPSGHISACTTALGCVGNGSSVDTPADLMVVNASNLPLEVGKIFVPSSSTGTGSRVTITIAAPLDIGVNGINLTDTLPAGMTVSTTPAVTTTCPGGTARVTATPGNNQIVFANLGTDPLLAAGGSCSISVNVLAGPGKYDNDIPTGAITTAQGRTNELDAATATLSLTSMTIRKAFYPDTIQANGKSRLTITIENSSATALQNLFVLDALPGDLNNGVVIANPTNHVTTCGGTFNPSAGSQTIQLTGGTVPARVGSVNGICTITLDVQGKDSTPTTSSSHVNQIPVANVTATVGALGPTIQPLSPANDTLNIRNLKIGVVKGFDPVLVYGGATSTMTIRLINPNDVLLTGVQFTDNMASISPGIILADPPMFNTGTCGGTLSGAAGASSFSFSGGILYPDYTCELTLRVVMNVNGNRTNRIPVGAVTTFNGVSTDQPTEASLTNLPGLSVVKMFNPNPVNINEVSTLTISISNTSNVPVVNMGLLDNFPTLPDGLVVAGPPNYLASNNCTSSGAPATLIATAGSDFIRLTGGSLQGMGNPSSSCVIQVNVISASPGAFENIIPVGGVTADGGIQNNNPGSDTLRVGSLYSLGNRVWLDTDNDGAIDASEVGVDKVTVQLYSADAGGNPTGPVRGAKVTDQGGYYRFDDLEPGNYVVVIPASQFAAGAPLAGYWSTGTSINASNTLSDSTATDPDNNEDSDENGLTQTSGAFSGAVISNAVTLGLPTSGGEPTNDDDAPLANPFGEAADNYSNRTVDFGFYRVSVGNLIFLDSNANGTYDSVDQVLPGATVQLFASNGTTEINVGPDGILGSADDAAGVVVSDIDGNYLFDGLAAGNYIIKVTPPVGGYTSTVDSADTTTPNSNINNNDNGVGAGAGQVSSNAVTLTPGSSGAQNQNTTDNSTGSTYNPTMDFGFLLYSLGNRVWFDTNNNNLIDGAEVGAGGVFVTLYRDDGDGVYDAGDSYVGYDITDSNGYYRFDDLPAGDYVVVIPNDNFTSGGYSALTGYWSSGTLMDAAGNLNDSTAADPDNDTDSDENGLTTFSSATITSANPISHVSTLAITLGGIPSEPSGETAPNGQGTIDNHANMTADFGFYRAAIGNLIFVNGEASGVDDGDYDAGVDNPLAGAVVTLYAEDGVTQIPTGSDGILGDGLDNLTGITTVASGLYSFSGLPAGNYIVKVTPPAGYSSIVDTAAPSDTTDPDTNTDNNDNGIGTTVGQVSSETLTMAPAIEILSASLTQDNTTGTTTDTSVDFGFTSPTYSLGNRVWFDTDNNGSIDTGERGVNGVVVELYQDTNADGIYSAGDTFITSATTAAISGVNGYYRFDNLTADDYVIVIPNDNFTAGGNSTALVGYWSSGTRRADGTGIITDTFGPDPDTDTDIDDNGVTTFTTPANPEEAAVSYASSAAVTLGPGSAEPVNENDPTAPFWQGTGDNRANMTVDFGFYRTRIGGLAFVDNNNNGIYNAGAGGDVPLENAIVQLFTSDGSTQIGGNATSNASGNYSFQNLTEGNYVIKITPPAGYASATDTAGSLDPDSNINNDDNGIGTASGAVITSGQLTMTPGEFGASTTATTIDNTVDFGFVPRVGIGNRVWFDIGTGAGGVANDGILNGTEAGAPNVTLQLYDLGIDGISYTSDDNLVATTTTSAVVGQEGYYIFDNLYAGQYYVKIPASEFNLGGGLYGYVSSVGNGGPNDDDDQDADENGIDGVARDSLSTNGIATPVYTLAPNTEPIADIDTNYTGTLGDASVNLTADFGFVELVAIGNRIWIDDGAGGGAADDGIQQAGEVGVNGVRVELYRQGQTPGTDTPVAAVNTSGSGDYVFDNLVPGNYFVHIPASQFASGAPLDGYISSTDTTAKNETSDQDQDENGIDAVSVATAPVTAGVSSNIFNLTVGGETTSDDEAAYSGSLDDANVNFTADFGFAAKVALGNLVWLDNGAGGGTANDGISNGTEPGVPNVDVYLYLSTQTAGDVPFRFTATDANGRYIFDNLQPGQYFAWIPDTEFNSGQPLFNLLSSLGNGGLNDDDDQNADENGIDQSNPSTTGISSPIYTLAVNTEPAADDDTGYNGALDDNNVNLTADFGFTELVAIGNRIWFDTDNNGILDGGEFGAPNGVVVELHRSSDNLLIATTATTTIGGNPGYYQFDNLTPGSYYVQIPASEFASGRPLNGYVSSLGGGAAGDNDDQTADENGVDANPLTAGIRTPDYNLQPNTAPTTDEHAGIYAGNLDNDNVNFTADFGFTQLVAIGNRIWYDIGGGAGGVADDGIQNGSEAGASGVTVQLYRQGQIPGTNAPVATTTTNAGGNYVFDNLSPGNYFVHVPASMFDATAPSPLQGFLSSTDTAAKDETTDEADRTAPINPAYGDENGIDVANLAANGISSDVFNLQPNTEPIDDDQTPYSGYLDNDNVNYTADFSFLNIVGIGNRVWLDTGTGGGIANNGIQDGTEPGTGGVLVELYLGTQTPGVDTPLEFTTTDISGYYVFDNLLAGTYLVHIPASNFDQVTDALYGYYSTEGNGTDETIDHLGLGGDENGIDQPNPAVSGITSTPYLLSANSEPTSDDDTGYTGVLDDNDVNFTADFGFVQKYSLGNRVWFDTNDNALMDTGEAGIDGVQVQLYRAGAGGNPTGAVIATDVTANGGYYLFDNIYAGEYVVVVAADNFTDSGAADTYKALAGYWSSLTTISAAGVPTENPALTPDPDDNGADGIANTGDDDIDLDDNGTRTTLAGFNGAVLSKPVIIGPSGDTEPTNENAAQKESGIGDGSQPNGRSNLKVDFGFYKLSVGDLVFSDGNKDGTYIVADDAPLSGVTVHLFSADGSTEILVGADGKLGTADDGGGGIPTTNASGLYRFDGLPAGNYIIRVDAPIGTSSTIDNGSPAMQSDNDNPNANLNNNDNGDGTGSGVVSSAAVTLTPGAAGAQSQNVITNGDGNTHNPTMDFGFVPAFSLGNRVWFDTNNNGVMDASEVGINNVLLEVYTADAGGNPTGVALGTATSANGGYYLFNPLPAGNYVVVVTAANFGGVLNGYWSSGISRADDGSLSESNSPNPNNDTDLDDNGMHTALAGFNGAVLSKPVTLGPNPTEPTNDDDLDTSLPDADRQGQPDSRGNMSVDFGFYTITLGSSVWDDADNNGNSNGGTEIGIDGVDVQLWSADGSTMFDSTTTVGGVYTFTGLSAGNYLARIPNTEFETVGTLVNYMSSTGTGLTTPISLGVYEPAPDADVNLADEDDNGTETGGTLGAGGYIQTAVVTLTAGAEASSNNANGSTSEPRVDFGVFSLPPGYIHQPLIGIAKNLVSAPVEVSPGTYQVVYDIYVENMGDTPLDNIQVTENLGATFPAPNGASVVSLTATGFTVNPAYNGSGSLLTGTDSLMVGGSGIIRLTINVIPYATGPFDNTAIASGTNTFGGARVTDDSQDGTNPDFNGNGDPTDDNAPTPVSFGPALFDPPIGYKTFNAAGLPLLEWTMIWINSTNIAAVNARVSDPIRAGATYFASGATSGFAVPVGAPAGSTNIGVSCTSPGAATTTTLCYYEKGSTATDLGRIVWEGTLGPDLGHTTTDSAVNELYITFRVEVPSDVNAVYNQATIDADRNGDNLFQAAAGGVPNELSVASGQGIWVRQDKNIDGSDEREGARAKRLPATGFAPNVVTALPKQPAELKYAETGGIQVEIPKLGIKTNVTGIPQAKDGTWDVTWLWNQAGWLQGTAYPATTGNSAITGHVYLPNGEPGIFVDLHTLSYGDKITLRAYGQKFTYEVRENKAVKPADVSVLNRINGTWITLITCQGYNEASNSYASRVAVQAVLLKVETDQQTTNEKSNSR
jgi:LPXTG-site transpeptidase (sortase) family protein